MRTDNDIYDTIAELSAQMYKQLDDVLKEAIHRHLGKDTAIDYALLSRMRMERVPIQSGTGTTIYYIDDVAILEVWDVISDIVMAATVLCMGCEYRFLV
jgi:hypothetical protein